MLNHKPAYYVNKIAEIYPGAAWDVVLGSTKTGLVAKDRVRALVANLIILNILGCVIRSWCNRCLAGH